MFAGKRPPIVLEPLSSSTEVLDRLQTEIDASFERARSDCPNAKFDADRPADNTETLCVSILEREDSIEIEAEVSGVKAQDVDVTTQECALVITASCREERNASYYLGEPTTYCIQRVIPLDFEIAAGSVGTRRVEGRVLVSVTKPASTTGRPHAELA